MSLHAASLLGPGADPAASNPVDPEYFDERDLYLDARPCLARLKELGFLVGLAECGCPPGEIAYVGDRLGNSINPALAAGMVTVFLRRGPWGFITPTTQMPPRHT